MPLSTEINDNVFHYLLPLDFSDLMVYSKVNKAWYYSARKAFYKSLTITGSTRVDLLFPCLDYNDAKLLVVDLIFMRHSTRDPLPIALERTASGLVRRCTNIKKIEINRVDPFSILRNIRSASLPKIVNWRNCSSSDRVRKYFYAANYSHKATIKHIIMPRSVELIKIDG